jgi:four helix bundle protein
MEQFRFKKWQVYQDSQKLFSDISTVVTALPRQYQNSLGDQISRSSLSIVLNIAEGSGKSSIKELNRFLDVALGSTYETLACIDTFLENRLITIEKQQNFEKRLESICSQIGGFKKKLRNHKIQLSAEN